MCQLVQQIFSASVPRYRDTKLIRNLLTEFITLDYSLGNGDTGMNVLLWMKENNVFVPHINIHSNHIFGRRRMQEFCEENFPDSRITMNMLPK